MPVAHEVRQRGRNVGLGSTWPGVHFHDGDRVLGFVVATHCGTSFDDPEFGDRLGSTIPIDPGVTARVDALANVVVTKDG